MHVLALVIGLALVILLMFFQMEKRQKAIDNMEKSMEEEAEQRLMALDWFCGFVRITSNKDPKPLLEKAFSEAGLTISPGYDFDPKMERSERAMTYFADKMDK